MTEPRKIPVVEIFGPTLQGEGPEVGTQSIFVRFGGCDFRCVWCDSSHAVLPENVRRAPKLSTQEILAGIRALPFAPLIVLSGGNPVLHDLSDLVEALHELSYRVSVETQGTLWKPWLNDLDMVICSPKPPSAQQNVKLDQIDSFLSKTVPRRALKIPCFDQADVAWAASLAAKFPHEDLYLSVVTSMGGLSGTWNDGHKDSKEDILARTLDVFRWKQDFRSLDRAKLIPQLHVLLWGHERGH